MAKNRSPLKHVVLESGPPKVFAKWVAAKKKLDKTVAASRLGRRRPWPE